MNSTEDRKIKEVEHSRIRRNILQGYERLSDTNKVEEVCNLDTLIRDKKAFDYHFSNIKFYSIVQKSENYKNDWLRERCKPGVKVLDFACGNGENGIYAAQCGAEVVGIDISPEGTENANMNAEQMGVADHCKFCVMDGENLTFPDNTFDLGVEYGALHHVDLDSAMTELCRVLKPDGEIICVEALRHNPLIRWYRRKTPHLRTKWEVEHILRIEDLDIIKKYFQVLNVNFFHLAALAAVPFRKTPIFKLLRGFLDKIDSVLLKNYLIGKYAWIMIFTLAKPGRESFIQDKNN